MMCVEWSGLKHEDYMDETIGDMGRKRDNHPPVFNLGIVFKRSDRGPFPYSLQIGLATKSVAIITPRGTIRPER